MFTYFCLLLVVASLCTGVTYARYVTQSQGGTSASVVPLSCSFSIDEVSSMAFANSDYMVNIEGIDKVMNAPRTIAFSVRNYDIDAEGNKTDISAIALQCTFRLYATKEFLDNVAFQIAQKGTGNTIIPLTQQYILVDMINAAVGGKTSLSTATDFANKDYGEVTGSPEETIALTNNEFSIDNGTGKIVAIAQTDDAAKELVATIGISAEKHTDVHYAVNFMRGKRVGMGNDMSAPAYYADCVAQEEVYYCLDITLPSMTMAAGTEVNDQYLFNFTLMNKQNSGELSGADLSYDAFKASLGDTKTLAGEHFNVIIPTYTDSACTTLNDTTSTVRVSNKFDNAGNIVSTEYDYVQGTNRIPMTVSGNVASCTVDGRSYYVKTQYDHNGTAYYLNDYHYNHEEGNSSFVIDQLVGKTYPVDIRVLFTQASQTAAR